MRSTDYFTYLLTYLHTSVYFNLDVLSNVPRSVRVETTPAVILAQFKLAQTSFTVMTSAILQTLRAVSWWQ